MGLSVARLSRCFGEPEERRECRTFGLPIFWVIKKFDPGTEPVGFNPWNWTAQTLAAFPDLRQY